MKYVSIDRVISKFHRETNKRGIEEDFVIEWIGEAMDFMSIYETLEQAVSFIEVKDFQCPLPSGFQQVLQVARDTKWSPCSPKTLASGNTCQEDIEVSVDNPNLGVPVDCNGKLLGELERAYYRPYFESNMDYKSWTSHHHYTNRYIPIRLSNHTFFRDLVCQEKNQTQIYKSCVDEYDIIFDNGGLRFSFKEGMIALAYLKSPTDLETGYPLIPEHISVLTAITYYIKWKISEKDLEDNREGSMSKASYHESRWLKYVKQAKSYLKMPKTIDDYLDILNISHQRVPQNSRQFGYFGNIANPNRTV